MSEKTREHISSLMDGEINPETSRFLVRRLGSDAELCATWARYHLVRDCLRNQDGTGYGRDLCARVARALEDEPEVRGSVRFASRWLRPVAGGAIAAGVAMMAVLLVDPGRSTLPESPAGVAESRPAASFVSPDGLHGVPGSRAVGLGVRPEASGRINPYLLRHYQATGGANGRGLVTFVPVMVQRGAVVTAEENPPQEAETDRGTDAQ